MPAIQFDLPGVDLSAKRANLYGLEAQSRQNALDEQARQIKARNLYGDAMAGGATPQDMTQMYADQGIPMEGQQMVNQMGTLQRQAPNRQALQSGVMYLSTLPDNQVVDAYKHLKAHAADQGMDTSFLPDESKMADASGNINPSTLKSTLMSTLDPGFGEKVMQFKEITEARKYMADMYAGSRQAVAQTYATSRENVAQTNKEGGIEKGKIAAGAKVTAATAPKRPPAVVDVETQKTAFRQKLLAGAQGQYYARHPDKLEAAVSSAFAGGATPAPYDPLTDPTLTGQ